MLHKIQYKEQRKTKESSLYFHLYVQKYSDIKEVNIFLKNKESNEICI